MPPPSPGEMFDPAPVVANEGALRNQLFENLTLLMAVSGRPVTGSKIPHDAPPEQVRAPVTTSQPVCPSAHEFSMMLPSTSTRTPSFSSIVFLTAQLIGQVLIAAAEWATFAGPHPHGGPGLPPVAPVRYL